MKKEKIVRIFDKQATQYEKRREGSIAKTMGKETVVGYGRGLSINRVESFWFGTVKLIWAQPVELKRGSAI